MRWVGRGSVGTGTCACRVQGSGFDDTGASRLQGCSSAGVDALGLVAGAWKSRGSLNARSW